MHFYLGIKARQVWEKYWLGVDKESKYLINGFLYIEKNKTRPVNGRASNHIVMQLMYLYLNKGRIVTDNYFTSVRSATQLKEKLTSLLRKIDIIS